ncbi:MAG: hypothetical protein PHR43_06725 [Dehalococcoidales bacterium]|nr:hypothetical protein [Dehalococcoidales bacterium]
MPLVELIYNAFCTEEAPQVRRLAREYGFPLHEYDIWEIRSDDVALPAHIRRKIAAVQSGKEGFLAGACFIDGVEVDWWAGFAPAFRAAKEQAHD